MSNSLEHNFTDNQEHAVKGLEVFVGGLSRTITEDKIHEVFSSCGQVMEVRLIKDQKGNLKGFCFIRFATKEAADRAVKEKSGVMIDGRKIGVHPSADQDTLFLGNLYKGWSADDFDRIVRQVFPDVVSVDLSIPFSSGEKPANPKQQNRGFALVKFSSHAAAARAYRVAVRPEFLLAGSLHPAVQWAEEEPEIDPKELAKIKIAFVRNLPASADENYLIKLFGPFGKVDKVVLSKKTRSPVGFVHFENRTDLDKAIHHMNGKTIQGPNGSPPFMIQVEVARPLEKSKKRVREDVEIKQPTKVPSYPKPVHDDPSFTSFGGYKPFVQEDPVLADPYEAAVVSLPVAVKERLLRILRLGIATRFDMDIQCLTSLKELPESAAITVLDQFMLSGADKHNKGAYLTGLISRYEVDKVGVSRIPPMSLSRVADISTREPEIPSFSTRVHHLPSFDSFSSHSAIRSDSLGSRYSSLYSDYPLSSRTTYGGGMEETSPVSLQHHKIAPPPLPILPPPAAAASSTPYGRIGLDSHYSFSTASDRQPSRPQVKFDPYTGEPYKFDPFTGEPILPEGLPRRYGSPY